MTHRTTIRFGASHNTLTLHGPHKGTEDIVLDLTGVADRDKSSAAALICEVHGIKHKRKRAA